MQEESMSLFQLQCIATISFELMKVPRMILEWLVKRIRRYMISFGLRPINMVLAFGGLVQASSIKWFWKTMHFQEA